jgi:hydrogenase maturation protease
VLAGIGNEMRHDDGAGPVVVARAAQLAPGHAGGPFVALETSLSEPLDLLGYWDGADLAIVVDAVRSGAVPGTVTLTWFEDGALTLRRAGRRRRPSTHGLGVADVYCLAHELGLAPRRAALVGVEGQDFSHGEGLSEPVDCGADNAATLVLELARAL